MAKDNGKTAKSSNGKSSSGFKNVVKGVKNQLGSDHVGIISAGVAFYFFLALFPVIAAIISIYGLVNDPAQVEQQMNQLANVLPEQAHSIITDRLKSLTQTSGQTLGWGVAFSILLSLWSANKGTKALFEGVNIAYNEENKRGFFKENGLTLLFTLVGMIVGIICMTFVVAFPAFIDRFGLPATIETVIDWGRWLVLAIVVALVFGLVYKVAPHRDGPKKKWWGAVIATLLWIAGSLAFSFYVKNFGSFDEMYGSVAAVIILMLWFYLTSFVILLGAEINSERERHTKEPAKEGSEKQKEEEPWYRGDSVVEEQYEYEKDRR